MTYLANKALCDLPRLKLPSWLDHYPSVADEAESIYISILQEEQEYNRQPAEARFPRKITASKQLEVLRRLATDQRMKCVWRELYRKERGSNEFLNPVKRQWLLNEKLTILHDPSNQDMAVRAFLNHAVVLAQGWFGLITQDEINSKAKPYSTMASRLRKDADGLRALGLSELAADVESVAISCEKSVYIPRPNILMPIVKRSRGDAVMRNYVLQLSAICRMGFDKGLTGTVATAASVALSKEMRVKFET
jgi:hypothetical protein